MSSAIELRDTEPAPPPDGAEVRAQSEHPDHHSPTWPRMAAVRLELTTDVLDQEEDIER